MIIVNYMEKLVDNNIDAVIERVGVCSCDKCKLDIKAIALNNLPPKYVVTTIGAVYVKLEMLEEQFSIDVSKEITKACMKVKNSPQHKL